MTKKTWFIILTIIIFWPLGLFFAFKARKEHPKLLYYGVGFVLLGLVAGAVLPDEETSNSNQLQQHTTVSSKQSTQDKDIGTIDKLKSFFQGRKLTDWEKKVKRSEYIEGNIDRN